MIPRNRGQLYLVMTVILIHLSACSPERFSQMELKDIFGLLCMTLFIVIPLLMAAKVLIKGIGAIIKLAKDITITITKPNIEKMKARRNVKGLIKALGYELGYEKDAAIRQQAAKALGDLGDPCAVEPLSAALKDWCDDVRAAAAKALGKIGDPRAAAPLIDALKGKDAEVRQAAAEALGKIGDPRAVEPLIAALKDRKKNVRKAAAEALDRLGWKPAQDEAAAHYWIEKREWQQCVRIGTPAVEPLIAALKDQNKDVRHKVDPFVKTQNGQK